MFKDKDLMSLPILKLKSIKNIIKVKTNDGRIFEIRIEPVVKIAFRDIAVCLCCSFLNIRIYSVDNKSTSYLSRMSKAIPPPLATQVKGSSATYTGIPV